MAECAKNDSPLPKRQEVPEDAFVDPKTLCKACAIVCIAVAEYGVESRVEALTFNIRRWISGYNDR